MANAQGGAEVDDPYDIAANERRWRPRAEPVLASVLALQSLLAAGFALWPPADTNRVSDTAAALVLALAAGACASAGRGRGPLWRLEAWTALAWVAPLHMIATRKLESSELLWSGILIVVAVVVPFYLPWRHALVQMSGIVIGYLIAALAFPPPTRPLFAVEVALTLIVCSVAAMRMRISRDRLLAVVSTMATTDSLTGVLNRRGIEAEAAIVRANARRSGEPTVVVLVDLDCLKRVNDTQGHRAGDGRLVSVASHWRAGLREGDLLARVGGDEFVFVLPQANEQEAARLLSRLRRDAPIEWSHGWTEWRDEETFDEAMMRADQLMYADKVGRRARREDDRGLATAAPGRFPHSATAAPRR